MSQEIKMTFQFEPHIPVAGVPDKFVDTLTVGMSWWQFARYIGGLFVTLLTAVVVWDVQHKHLFRRADMEYKNAER